MSSFVYIKLNKVLTFYKNGYKILAVIKDDC